MTFLFAAFNWFRSSTVGRALAMVGGVLLALFVVFQRGKAAQRKQQKIDDLEFGAEIRKRTDKAEHNHEADMAQLPDDPDARRRELAKRLHDARRRGGG